MDDSMSMDQGPKSLVAEQFFDKVDRNFAQREMSEMLGLYGYGVEHNDFKLVNSVWERKNQLFTALGEEEKKLFHDEAHTNRVVVLTSWALKAAHENPKLLKEELSPEIARNSIIAAISHDWGYLKPEGEKVTVDFSVPGNETHEDRSKKQIHAFLAGKAGEEDILNIEEYIESTKYKYPTTNGKDAPAKNKLLRWADLLSGGITVTSEALYRDLIHKLAYEYYLQDPKKYSNIKTKARDIMELDQTGFFGQVEEETELFVQLLSKLGEEYDLSKVINRRVSTKLGETLPFEEAPLANIAIATRRVKDKYLEVFEALGKDYDEARLKMSDSVREEINNKYTKWIEEEFHQKYLSELLPRYTNVADDRLTEVEKKDLKIIIADLQHDIGVVTTFLSNAIGDESLSQIQQFINPIMVNHPAEVLERAARSIEGKKVTEELDPGAIAKEMADFFRIFLSVTPNAKVDYIGPESAGLIIKGDRLDLKTAIFNVMRNTQKRINNGKGNNLHIEVNSNNQSVKIIVKDDTGGFDEELLEETAGLNSSGEKIKTQKALVRGITTGEESGSGFGLDITRRIIEDQFKGKVLLRNEVSLESGQRMGVVEIDIPV